MQIADVGDVRVQWPKGTVSFSFPADIPFTPGACSPTWRTVEDACYCNVELQDVGSNTPEGTL